ncbi:ArnT family glycosyltransferase [Streptomyces aurantiacus]|uniref:ArnT family glycosyltransferase n=1 Tax=Streptomyces aurantiacus TaxID=47760 RepID=UPI0027D8A5A5|nr:glycosyltransferase family 39 protein [Streptomyces aurantiacus]
MPSFSRPYWSPDEGYLGTEAVLLREGGTMYVDVVDRKPPLLPWLYQASFAITDSHGLWLVRVLAVVALALTGVLAARLAARWWGSWAEFPAGVLTVAGSAALPAPDAMAATFEIFMLPATVAAMYYGARSRFLLAGLAVAIATLTKQVGLALLLPLAVQILFERRRSRQGAALAAGVALPLALCALLLGVRPFTFWVFLSSGSYASSPPAVGEVIGRATGSLVCLLSAFAICVVLMPLLPWRNRLRRFRPGVPADEESAVIPVQQRARRRPGISRTLGLWLLASLTAVAAGWHFYGHYFLQLVPPMALGSLWLVDAAWRAGSAGPRKLRQLVLARGRAGAAAMLATCALSAAGVWTATAVQARPPEMDKVLRVVTVVEERTAPGQRVLQWGMHPEIYWLSGRRPASRYLTAGLLTNFSGGGDPARVGPRYAVPGTWGRFRRELAESPPCLVVDDSSETPYRLAEYPQLRELLAQDYHEVAEVEGTRLYKRTTC